MTVTQPLRKAGSHVLTLTVAVVLLGATGNLFLSWGMKTVSVRVGLHPLAYVMALASPLVSLGVVLLILWLLMRMVLLSLSDLSYVLPATASGYVVNALLSVFVLKEHIDIYGWAGTILITIGAALVASEPRGHDSTAPVPENAAADFEAVAK